MSTGQSEGCTEVVYVIARKERGRPPWTPPCFILTNPLLPTKTHVLTFSSAPLPSDRCPPRCWDENQG